MEAMRNGAGAVSAASVFACAVVLAGPAAAQQTCAIEPTITTRVSVDSAGNQGNDHSERWGNAQISADGRYVVFDSYATNLVPGDTNNVPDIFVHDRLTGKTVRVSVNSANTQANSYSVGAAISGDGRYVAFDSSATNLVSGDTNHVSDVFVHDCVTGETTRVSVDSMENQANGRSVGASITSDGRYVAFVSLATNLVPGDTNDAADVFVHDRVTGETTRVSLDSAGNEGNDDSTLPSLSGDGRYVAFKSYAKNLVPGDTNNATDIFVHDRVTGETMRVSVDSAGNQANGDSWDASISADSRLVTFTSGAYNLVSNDTNKAADIFVHDRLTGETTRVSVDSAGNQGKLQRDSESPSISANGRYVAFASEARLAPDDSSKFDRDIFVHDRDTGQTRLVSVTFEAKTLDLHVSDRPSISADGRYVAFSSFDADLVPGDTNQTKDVFVRGPELTLEADPSVVTVGQTLTLTEYKSVPGNPASLWAVDVNGTSVSLLILSGSIGGDGNFAFTGVVPPGLSGSTVTFRGYAIGQSGLLIETNDETVWFQ